MDQQHSALDPAYRSREPHRVAAQRIGRCAAARSPLGMRHHRFDVIEFARQPRGQTVRQQAEGGVALGAVPASDLRPARGLARVGAVACQRTFAVRVIRAAIEPCIAPRLGPNVSLAGEPRLVPKLQPAVARRGRPPARANSFLVQRAVETTTRLPRHQAVTMWTRPPVKLGQTLRTEHRPTDRVDKAWTSARHLTTPSPHSALSRPRPHRLDNNRS